MKNSTIEGFVNAQLMNFYHPQTYQVPTLQEIMEAGIGDYVKVNHNSERFWCIIKGVWEDGLMELQVDNKLTFSEHPFNLGDTIYVYPHHIHDVVSKEDMSREG